MLGQEKGWLATSGSRLFETHRASHTSNYVRQAEAIGLVPLDKPMRQSLVSKYYRPSHLWPSKKPLEP